MSNRGFALKGRYKGIYEKTLADGTKVYTFRVKFNDAMGKKCEKQETYNSKRGALQRRSHLILKRNSGALIRKSMLQRPEIHLVATEYLASKQPNRSYDDIARIVTGARGPIAFFGEAFDLRNISDSDITRYRNFLDTCFKEPTFKRLNPARRKIYIPDSSTSFLSNRTKNSYLIHLQAILAKALKMGLIRYVPEIVNYFVEDTPELEITLEDIIALIKLMPLAPKPHRAIIMMNIFSAQRWSDLSTMKKKQILGPITAGTPVMWYSTKTQSRNKPRKKIYLPMPRMLAAELQTLSQTWDVTNEFLFPNPRTELPYTSIKKSIETACQELGISKFRPNLDLRHLSATEYLRDLKDAHAVAKIMGHGSTQMIDARYGHLVDRANPGVEALDKKWEKIEVGQRWGT